MYSVEILVITLIACSLLGWFKDDLQEKLVLDTWAVRHHREWYRLITNAFVHGGIAHLFFNIVTLRSCGDAFMYNLNLGDYQELYFWLLFLGGVLFSSVQTQLKHAKKEDYKSLGASGGITSLVTLIILHYPTHQLSLFFIPIPGWIFLIIWLGIDFILRNKDTQINHSAHLAGALYGLLFALWLNPNVLGDALTEIISS